MPVDVKENAIDIYPNPISTSTFFLHNKQAAILKIQFINLSGNIQKQFWIHKGQSRLSVGDMPRGVYFVKVIDGVDIIQSVTVLVD